MAAPIEKKEAFVKQMRDAFLAACPDVPMCKHKVQRTFEELGDDDDLFNIATLADNLGLTITFTVSK